MSACRKFLSISMLMLMLCIHAQHDSTRRVALLRGNFRWILSPELYEEGVITDNLKDGIWKRFYNGKIAGRTSYTKGLAESEDWALNDSFFPRYRLSPQMDTMIVYHYDKDGILENTKHFLVDTKRALLNYSLLTEDSLFKKQLVMQRDYVYKVWNHRNDVVLINEKAGDVSVKKYYLKKGSDLQLMWEMNDKGDVISGNRKEFLKEVAKDKKAAKR